jgi:molybdopterin-synthase adenylyltransferase
MPRSAKSKRWAKRRAASAASAVLVDDWRPLSLSDEELERYARHIVLPQVGGVGQRKLKAAKVAIIGAGGVGSAVIPALAGAGVGQLTIIDSDTVEVTNLHRQPLYREEDAGKSKGELAAGFVRRLNHFVEARPVQERIGPDNTRALLAGYDLVIDGSDNFATRLAVSDASVALRVPLISAAAVQFQGQVGLFRSKPCYRCFVGDAFDADDCDNCSELGVLGALTATVGSFAALLAINTIVGIGEEQAGKLHLFDGEKLEWRAIGIPPDPKCRACGSA